MYKVGNGFSKGLRREDATGPHEALEIDIGTSRVHIQQNKKKY